MELQVVTSLPLTRHPHGHRHEVVFAEPGIPVSPPAVVSPVASRRDPFAAVGTLDGAVKAVIGLACSRVIHVTDESGNRLVIIQRNWEHDRWIRQELL